MECAKTQRQYRWNFHIYWPGKLIVLFRVNMSGRSVNVDSAFTNRRK